MSDDTPVPAGDFVADTQLTADPQQPGRYRGAVSTAWQIVDVFGGMQMAVALRPMFAALGRPELKLISATSTFVDRVPCGPVTVDVEVLRNGRRIAQVASRLRAGDSDQVAVHTQAVFGIEHDTDLGLQEVEFPVVSMPEDIDPPEPPPDDFEDMWQHVNFHDQTDWRPANGVAPWDPIYGKGPAKMCSWVRLVKDPLLADGTYDPLVLALHGDQIGSAVGQGLGPVGPYFTLSLEIGIRFISAPTAPWVLQESEAWHVGDGYATGPLRLWGSDGRLLAIATQTAFLAHRLPSI
ncbi:MAG: acyl-CoA thioesterase-like protein [Actinomycetia bacterium]|nr:acyl-CoA thioesterase-like protein [Actinomycetes bacterium]